MNTVESKARTFMDDAKVMPKGQVTIPKDVREVLGVGSGDRVTFIVDNGKVTVVNTAAFAMDYLQKQMAGEAEKAGIRNELDVVDLVKSIRE